MALATDELKLVKMEIVLVYLKKVALATKRTLFIICEFVLVYLKKVALATWNQNETFILYTKNINY